jgi:hypothetical protein
LHRQEAKQLAKQNGVPVENYHGAVIETYHRHDRELLNVESRRLFAAHPPVLDEVQRRCVEELRTEGLAIVPFSELVRDERLWQRLADDAADFARQGPELLRDAAAVKPRAAEKLERAQAKGKVISPEKLAKMQAKAERASSGGMKATYIARRFEEDRDQILTSPWLDLARSPRLLDVVNSYHRHWAKVQYIDLWYTGVSESQAERITSQRWHRDNNDQYLVKAFLYMTDVDGGSGPLEYVPGSALGGRYSSAWPWAPLGEMYPPQREFHDRIPESAVRTLTAPKGTLILCNTSGFHRGGFATERTRVMGIVTYVSPGALATIVERGFPAAAANLPPDTPEAVRYALS